MAGISEQSSGRRGRGGGLIRRGGEARAVELADMQIVSKKCRTTAGCLNYLFIRVEGRGVGGWGGGGARREEMFH